MNKKMDNKKLETGQKLKKIETGQKLKKLKLDKS